MKEIKKMSKENNRIFMMWMAVVIISFFLQSVGNTIIPEAKNYGIICAILMSLVLLFDFLGENVVKRL